MATIDKGKNDKGYWRAIYISLWNDKEFQALSPNDKLVLLNIRTSPLSNRACIYPFYTEAIRKQTGLPECAIKDSIDMLKLTGWIEEEEGIVWVKNALRFDPNISLKSIDHVTKILTDIKGLPKLKIVQDFLEFYGLSNYPDSEEDNKAPVVKSKEEKDSINRIVNAWNLLCGKVLPVVTFLTDVRMKHLKARMSEEPNFEFWEKLFKRIVITPFLLGENDRKWRANFDWVINRNNLVKIVEGNWPTTQQLAADTKTPVQRSERSESSRSLWENCKKCGKESLRGNLNHAGLCFNCNPEAAMNQERLKELMANIGKKTPGEPPTT